MSESHYVVVHRLIAALHKSIGKLLCFNMYELNITVHWTKKWDTITN